MARTELHIKSEIIAALGQITDPAKGKTLLDAKMVEEVEIQGGALKLKIVFEDDRPKSERWDLEDKIHDAVEPIEGVTDISIIGVHATALTDGPRQANGHGHDHGHDHGHAHDHGAQPAGAQNAAGGTGQSKALEGVGKIIAVASGKGGVGKSTIAVNLALALKKIGYKVGLLDIDVYGPSLPTLLGVKGRPAVRDRRIVPLEAEGLRIMSLGFLMDDDTPVIWRGPIVSGIIRQFLHDVDWSGLDYLIIDLPPGTGDAQLSLAQSVPLDGAIVVTTPSELALVDAARGLQMFKTLKVEVLGILENMSYYIHPGSGEKIDIFGHGTAKKEAKRLGTEYLGEIPLDPEVRKGGDQGKPIVVADPEGAVSQAFVKLATRIAEMQPVGKDAEEKPKRRGLFSFLKG